MQYEQKQFIHSPIELGYNDLVATTTETSRVYRDPDGNDYPSVTSVLSILSRDSIAAWKRRVGEEEARKIGHRASTRGTAVHNVIERYLANDPDHAKGAMPNALAPFLDVKPTLDKNVTKIYNQEAALYSKHLGLAGRVDLVGQWNGVDSIIDWKTSAKLKKKEWIHSYFMQCSAYAIMFEERTGHPIKQLVVCVAGDQGVQVFIEDRDNWAKPLINTIKMWRNEQ
ncbi:MAG TPA: exonuclease [Flavobacteriales bacterium]|nr:exonuclease [Flavobacteriales bacterium]